MPGLDLGMIAMNDSFFSHLEDSTVRELLARTPLQDAALVTVGPSLHIENYNDAARQLIRLPGLFRSLRSGREKTPKQDNFKIAHSTPKRK